MREFLANISAWIKAFWNDFVAPRASPGKYLVTYLYDFPEYLGGNGIGRQEEDSLQGAINLHEVLLAEGGYHSIVVLDDRGRQVYPHWGV